jgi:hypothetical protein
VRDNTAWDLWERVGVSAQGQLATAPESSFMAALISATSPSYCPPTDVRNPDTCYLDVSVTHPHGLAMLRSEPAPDEIGTHANGEPVIEQSCSGTALLPPAAVSNSSCGEQFECTTLVRVESTFFMQSTDRIALRRDPRRGDG